MSPDLLCAIYYQHKSDNMISTTLPADLDGHWILGGTYVKTLLFQCGYDGVPSMISFHALGKTIIKVPLVTSLHILRKVPCFH
jgi:hypothetical protein